MQRHCIKLANGHSETAALLLDNGAQIDKRNARDQTPLMLAVNRKSKCVKLLLERKADATAASGGKTALDIAQEKKLDEIVALLQFATAATPPAAPPAPVPHVEATGSASGTSEWRAHLLTAL